MTPERIVELAKKAGFVFYDMHDINGEDLGETIEADTHKAIHWFAEMIRNHALDEAAKACEQSIQSIWEYHPDQMIQVSKTVCNNLATKLRGMKT